MAKPSLESAMTFFLDSSNTDDSQAPIKARWPLQCCWEHGLITLTDMDDLLKSLTLDTCILNKGYWTWPDRPRYAKKKAGESLVSSRTTLFNHHFPWEYFHQHGWGQISFLFISMIIQYLVDNYRPVSLLSCICKVFKRAVFKYVFKAAVAVLIFLPGI